MHQSVTSSKMNHLADYTNLLFRNKNPKVMDKILNQELKSVFKWLCANRLSINVTKTEFIIFKPPKRPLTLPDLGYFELYVTWKHTSPCSKDL